MIDRVALVLTAAIWILPACAQTNSLCSVEGQVVSSAGGSPVRRAVVTLQRTTGRPVLPGQPPQTPMSSVQMETDDQGHFAFRELEAGGYRVTVQRQGFVGQNGTFPGPPNVQLWLGEGQQLTGYVVRATPQSVIAGRVVDEYGDPVMGAQVFAERAGSASAGRPNMSAGNAQSNDLGEYRIANLSGGDYTVAASYQDRNRVIFVSPNQPPSPEKPQFVYATTYHPSTAVASEAAPVHVTDGAVIGGIDVKLTKITAFSIRVTVADPGAPLNAGGAFPSLRQRDPAAAPGGGFFGPSRQADGSYLFTNVPPGAYELTAQRNSPGTPGSVASASMPIEVRDHNLDGIVLEVKPNADLQGTVRFEQPGQCDASNMSVSLRLPERPFYGALPQPARVGDDLKFTLKSVPPAAYSVSVTGTTGRCYVKSKLYGGRAAPEGPLAVNESGPLEITLAPYNGTLNVTVVDGDGNPAPRARISAVPKDGIGMNMGTMGSMSGANGQMTFGSLSPGAYDVYAFENPNPGNPGFPLTPDYLKAFESRAKTVTVPETGRATVQVTAIPASETRATAPPPPAGAMGSLAGRVVNAVNGSAVAGVTVTLRGQFSAAGPQGVTAVTDDRGRFAFPDLAPGSYGLEALEQGFTRTGYGASLNPYQAIVGEGQQVSAYVLRVVPAGVIAGTLKDESGEPVAGAQVNAYRYRNDLPERRLVAVSSAQTDDLGSYRMANLAPADYYVSVARAQPRRDAQAQAVESIAGPMPAEAETDYVRMWYPNATQPSAATAIRVAAGATAGNVDMMWRKTRVVRIRGKVADAADGAVRAPIVTLVQKDSPRQNSSVGSATVARDGSFEISAVPPGSYNLIARPGAIGGGVGAQVDGMFMAGRGGPLPSVRLAVQAIEVKDSPIDGIKLELRAGRTVKGAVKMDGGGPVSQPGFLSLTSLEGGAGGGMINIGGDGTFTVNNIFPVAYMVGSQNLPANCYVKSIRYAGQEVALTGFEFTGDGQLEVVLSNTAAVLEGSVTGADGTPAGNAAIAVVPAAGPSPVRTGSADAHGNFYFANLPPGDYRVLAWDAAAPEASDPPESLGRFESAAKTVKLGESAREKIQVTVAVAR